MQVRGAAQVDVPVQPYFVINGESFQRTGNTLAASCTVAQATAGRAIERVTLYVGTTQFVDINNNAARADLTGTALADLSKPLNFSLALPAAVTAKGYFYARIGVKTAGIAEMLYTPVQKITM